MRRQNENFLLHNSELYPSGAIPNPPIEKPKNLFPIKRSKRRGGNKHTKLIYKGGSDDTISAHRGRRYLMIGAICPARRRFVL